MSVVYTCIAIHCHIIIYTIILKLFRVATSKTFHYMYIVVLCIYSTKQGKSLFMVPPHMCRAYGHTYYGCTYTFG